MSTKATTSLPVLQLLEILGTYSTRHIPTFSDVTVGPFFTTKIDIPIQKPLIPPVSLLPRERWTPQSQNPLKPSALAGEFALAVTLLSICRGSLLPTCWRRFPSPSQWTSRAMLSNLQGNTRLEFSGTSFTLTVLSSLLTVLAQSS